MNLKIMYEHLSKLEIIA